MTSAARPLQKNLETGTALPYCFVRRVRGAGLGAGLVLTRLSAVKRGSQTAHSSSNPDHPPSIAPDFRSKFAGFDFSRRLLPD